ncbi:MAG TPA: DUF1801 domain-containing protein [Gemmatimonadales bacterium]|jgi:hypothetical protein
MTVAEFLAGLPAERRAALHEVRAVIRKRLPAGYREEMAGKAIVWVVPLSVYPDTYNGHALWYVGLASPKSYASLHMVMAYMNDGLTKRLEDGFKKAGKKLRMGKGCVNFDSADDLALDVIGDVVAAVPMEKYVAVAKQSREDRKKVKKVKKV